MDRGAWQATVHEVARVGHDVANKTHFHFYFIFLNKKIKRTSTREAGRQSSKGRKLNRKSIGGHGDINISSFFCFVN